MAQAQPPTLPTSSPSALTMRTSWADLTADAIVHTQLVRYGGSMNAFRQGATRLEAEAGRLPARVVAALDDR